MEADFDDPFASLTEYNDQSVNNPPMEYEEAGASSVPPIEPQSAKSEEQEEQEDDVVMEEEPSEQENSPFIPLAGREDAPLANIIAPEYHDVDPRFVL